MKEEKQTCFRNEIRKSLIIHALAPCILSLIVLIMLFMLLGTHQVVKKSRDRNQSTAQELEVLIQNYQKGLEDSQDCMKAYLMERSDLSSVAEAAYRFLNLQEERGDFYLFDEAFQPVFSTGIDRPLLETIQNYLRWSGNKQQGAGAEIHFLYDNRVPDQHEKPLWLIYRPLISEEEVIGYSAFALSADRFLSLSAMQNPSVIVVNRFYRMFLGETPRFFDSRGKLLETYREKEGYVHNLEKWHYVTGQWILNKQIKVYSVYDCTFLVQLFMMALVIVLILGVIICGSVYISAGHIADKKTEILYELVDALEQVEKGGLDTTLQITTGDEFETIGKSFNMMLGSIRHLIKRHQELAQENILANMQIMESQFNPHFLFNTLESIRYMIHFDAGDAEKMIVSLSRLLRYSIQGAKDEVELGTEIDFIHQYLQIMMYRYGKRLDYQIDLQEREKNIRVPRMILQPIVENSIKYGYADDREFLQIRIRIIQEDKTIRIRIEDNGSGIDAVLLEELKHNLKQDRNKTSHIGLYNVNKRIVLMYGAQYGLSIESREGSGMRVDVSVPVHTEDKKVDEHYADEDCHSRG